MSTAAFREALREALTAGGDPERARQQRSYMKSAMPYAGVAMPVLRKLAGSLCKTYPCHDANEWETLVRALWDDARVREERYAALEVLTRKRYMAAFLQPEHLPLLRHLVTTGAWWDLVDGIATTAAGHLLARYPDRVSACMYQWAEDDNLWVRRTAILCQLKFKAHTDTALLYHAIKHSQADPEFFARKAIGWALREYSKTAPQAVLAFIHAHEHELSALSKREGLKHLKKQSYSLEPR